MKLLKGKKGFTLIELVVVIAILGILAGIAIPRFLDATATARGSKIVADMRTVDSAIVIYNAKTGNLPTKTTDLTTSATGANASSYQLLASWPVPPTGTAIITANDGKPKTITNDATTYTLGAATGTAETVGRCLFGGKTVDQLLAKEP